MGTPPPRCGQTENITFPILRMRAVKTDSVSSLNNESVSHRAREIEIFFVELDDEMMERTLDICKCLVKPSFIFNILCN